MIEKNIDFDKVIDRKNTDCIKYDFAEEKGMPKDILPLWVADMDFQTSSLILDALHSRVEHGVFGYSESKDHYFEAVAGWLQNHHGLTIEKDWVVKTPGIVFALALAIQAFTKAGDAVLVQQPVYYPFSRLIKANGRVVVSSDLVLNENNHYEIDFADMEQKIVENHIKLFLFCSPHNPVGRVWTREELRKIADICLKHGVIVVSDEIHSDFVYDGYQHTPLLTMDERLKEICITCTSPAKTFNLAGLQVSNIIIPNKKLRDEFKQKKSDNGYDGLNCMGLVACEAAYTKGEVWYEALMKYLHENLDFLRAYLEKELPMLKLIEPEGTYLAWIDFRALGLSEEELQDLIVNKAKLWLDAGVMFGKGAKGFERVNIATSRSILMEALNRLKDAIKAR